MTSAGRVIVTGASGYIAKHLLVELLNAGHEVTGSVRSLAREAEVRDAIAPQLADSAAQARLRFVELDLGADAGWAQAMTGHEALIHTASPFPMSPPRHPDDLIRPAVDGTLRALRAAADAGLGRVVLTSSVAAIMGAGTSSGRSELTEADWTDPESAVESAYTRSKTLAERAAWHFAQHDAPGLALTVLNPGFVTGPPLDGHYGTSLHLIERLLRRKDPMLPRSGFPVVDVRDVARAHLAALHRPASIGNRYILADRFMWFADFTAALAAALPGRRLVHRQAPNAVLRLLALFDPSIRQILPNLGRRYDLQSTSARRDLSLEFLPAAESIGDAGRWLVQNGRV